MKIKYKYYKITYKEYNIIIRNIKYIFIIYWMLIYLMDIPGIKQYPRQVILD